jgi:two-component system nitrogen regulation response regulator GlnG
MLTRHFLQQSAKQLGVEPKRISDAALARLGTFNFPGNVRQLENICHWLTVMAPSQVIDPKDLPPEVLAAVVPGPAAPMAAAPAQAALTGDVAPAPAVWPAEAAIVVPGLVAASTGGGLPGAGEAWETGLEVEANALLASGRHDVWDELTRRFESKLILAALASTRGRRIEAAQKLGIGRNTITRKIQELGLE